MTRLGTTCCRLWAIAGLAVLLAAAPVPGRLGGSMAAAQGTSKAQNQKVFDAFMNAARVLYGEQKYDEAIIQFEKAFQTIPDPKIWFNLGQCHRLLKHVEQSLLYYRKFLDALPTIKDLPQAKKVAVEKEVRQWVDELEKEKAAEDERLRQEEADKAERERLAREKAGQDPKTPGTEPGMGPQAPGSEGGLTSKWWFWTGVGATVVLTAVTVWAGTQALSYNDAWKKDWDPADRDSAEQFMNLTDLSLAGAVVAGVAVSVATFLHLKNDRPAQVKGETAPVSLLPSCDGSGCSLSLTLKF